MQISENLLRVIFLLSTIVAVTDCCSSRLLLLKEHTLQIVQNRLNTVKSDGSDYDYDDYDQLQQQQQQLQLEQQQQQQKIPQHVGLINSDLELSKSYNTEEHTRSSRDDNEKNSTNTNMLVGALRLDNLSMDSLESLLGIFDAGAFETTITTTTTMSTTPTMPSAGTMSTTATIPSTATMSTTVPLSTTMPTTMTAAITTVIATTQAQEETTSTTSTIRTESTSLTPATVNRNATINVTTSLTEETSTPIAIAANSIILPNNSELKLNNTTKTINADTLESEVESVMKDLKTVRDLLSLPCSGQFNTEFCLNRGRCFRYPIGNDTIHSCICADGYIGERCESKSMNGSFIPSIAGAHKKKIAMARIVFSFPMLVALSVIYIMIGAAVVFRRPASIPEILPLRESASQSAPSSTYSPKDAFEFLSGGDCDDDNDYGGGEFIMMTSYPIAVQTAAAS